ncbi:hypothetical protein IMCC3317_02890 [Kordia antarctica]|uniref:Uncharacterized protein n=1 Tax=Kordia antarctica TaxID=1218801 RepID=A0A7L4ZG86_9FLAO|nr:hypothetical protein [Kordia antarctica]QHI34944.1 hypothetical protein IMCC3317_02890 [Kordia antarctica]
MSVNSTAQNKEQPYFPKSYFLNSNSSFLDIKNFADAHLEISVQVSNYLEQRDHSYLRNTQGYNEAETDKKIEEYKESVVSIYQKDFEIFQKLNDLDDKKLVNTWLEISKDAYYYLFNCLTDNTIDKAKKLINNYFFLNNIELPVAIEAIMKKRRSLFSKLFDVSGINFDLSPGWESRMKEDDGVIYLNHIKRTFLERKKFFFSILRVNLLQIEHYLSILVEVEEKEGIFVPKFKYFRKDFNTELNNYIDALNYSHDFMFFEIPSKPKNEIKENDSLNNEDDKEFQELINEMEKLHSDFTTMTAATTLKKVNEIHKKLFEVKKTEDKSFVKDYFKKGQWNTLSPSKQKEFLYGNIISLGNIAAKDIGSGIIGVFNAKDKGKAAEKLGEKLLQDMLPVALSALGMAFGGPLLGSFLQGMTGSLLGAMFGKPPSPFDALSKQIKNVEEDIHILQNIVVTGFNKVLEDTSLIIRKEGETQQLIIGLESKMKGEFDDLKSFIKDELKEQEIDQHLQNITDSINNLHASYGNMLQKGNSGTYIAGDKIVEDLKKMMILIISGGESNYDFTSKEYSILHESFQGGALSKIIKSNKKEEFVDTLGKLIKIFNNVDRVLSSYAQYRKLHFTNNAIIGFIETNSIPTLKQSSRSLFLNVVDDLIKMQTRDNEGLITALQMHGKLIELLVLGKNNLQVYSKYQNASQNDSLPFLDSFSLAEVNYDGTLKFQDKAKHIPKWVNFDVENQFDDTKPTFSRYFTANLGESKLINFGDQPFGQIFLPTLNDVKLSFSYNDTISLMDKNGKPRLVQSVPYNYSYKLENSDNKEYIFKNELEFLFTDVGGFNVGKGKSYNYYKDTFNVHAEVHQNVGEEIDMLKINDTILNFSQTIWQKNKNENATDFKLERRANDKFVSIAYQYGWPDLIGEIKSTFNLDNFFKFDIKTKENIFELGDEIFSPNKKYKLHFDMDDLIIENVESKKTVWSLGYYMHLDKLTLKNAKAALTLDKGELNFNFCSDTINPKFAETFSLSFPQKNIIKLWLDDDGTIQIFQKYGINKYRQRRLFLTSLLKDDYLLPGEYIHDTNLKREYPKHLLLTQNGNLILNAAHPGKIPKIIWDANLGSAQKTNESEAYKLHILNARLILESKNDKNENFTFTQRYVENLYISKSVLYINSEAEKDRDRRLILYALFEDDVLYENEQIYSPNKKYYFKVLPKAKMECKYNSGKPWVSGGDAKKENLTFKTYNATFKKHDEFITTGYTFQFYSDNDICINPKEYRGFYLRTFVHDDLNRLYSSLDHADRSGDFGKDFDTITMLYMMNDGTLVGMIETNERKFKYYDLGLISSHMEHGSDEVKIKKNDWINGPEK